MKTHIVLVPGFWLGSWAWDAVLPHLERSDTRVTSLTLPGLDAVDTDRSAVTFDAHVRAVVDRRIGLRRAHGLGRTQRRRPGGVRRHRSHPGSRPLGSSTSTRAPCPTAQPLRPDLASDVIEIPLPTWAELEADGSSLEGLDEKALETFRANAVPEPAGPAREPIVLTNEKRYQVPSTVVCSTFPSAVIAQMADGGHPMAAELAKLPVTYVDLPTGHWPMWSRPEEVANVILEASTS